jgi:hypothetical protein
MIFPLVDRYKVYTFEGNDVVIRHQDLFRQVFLQTIVTEGESHFITVNWWKFVFNASFAYEFKHSKYEDNYRKSLEFV